MTVRASDAGGLFDEQALAVTVTNVNGATQNGNANANTLTGTPEGETMNGAGGADTLNGNGGNDTLNGDGGADIVNGGDGDDIVNGLGGIDTMNGGNGNDRMTGGAGVDTMTGGAGIDTFVYNATVTEIGNNAAIASMEHINDFEVGVDKIDLSLIDANAATTGNQAFTFLTTQGAGFTAAGQIRFLHQQDGLGVWHTIIEGNVTGTNGSEFRIDLVGQLNLTAADFIL